MISVPIPMPNVEHSSSSSTTFISSQQHMLPPPPPPKIVGSKHVSSSSYSKTIISSSGGMVPVSMVMPSQTQTSSSFKGSSSSTGCSGASFTYNCEIVYGASKRTRLCQTVPIETAANCCSTC